MAMTPDEVKEKADRAERMLGQPRTTAKPQGRPSEFTQQIADTICEKLADGESLRKICADETMPSKSTVFRWLSQNTTFQDQYARARETQADVIADEILHIADTTEDPQKARLQIDSRKWLAGKMRPKKYGDRATLELEGEIGVRKAAELTDDELASIVARGSAGASTASDGAGKPH